MTSPLNKSLFFSLIFLSLSWQDLSSAVKEEVQEECGLTPSPYRVSVRHIEGKGIGYKKGYTSVDLFAAIPSTLTHRWTPFFDGRLHIFNDGKIATNIGMGLRYTSSSFVYGINQYYDYRETHRQKYNQYSLGLEALGKVWDFRVNGHLPVGSKRSSFYDTHFAYFLGNQIILARTQEFAMKGVNAEAGIHIKKMKDMEFYGAFGPYYFEQAGRNAIGGKARLSGTFLDHIKVELSTSYDPIFHWIGQGELSFLIPFGPKKKIKQTAKCSKVQRQKERAVQSVDRQEIIVVDKKTTHPAAINPATNLPFFVVFVDNTSHSLGTYESPYPTLKLAEAHSGPNDILYVFPGNQTTENMDEGIILQKDQKFWGSNLTRVLETTQGMITVPAQSTSAPMITNTLGDVITLATGNEISGFRIECPANPEIDANGVYGSDSANVAISSCAFENPDFLSNGIHLEYTHVGGKIALEDLAFTKGHSPVWITSTAEDPIELTMEACTLEEANFYTLDLACADKLALVVKGCQFLNNVNGVLLNFSGESSLEFSDNIFSGQTSGSEKVIAIEPHAAPWSARFENNIIKENKVGSININCSGNASAQLEFVNNHFVDNDTGDVSTPGSSIYINPNGHTLDQYDIAITDNLFLNNKTDTSSLFIDSGGLFTDLNVTVLGNTMSGNKSALIFGNNVDIFTLNCAHNTIENQRGSAISIQGATLINSATIIIEDNTIKNIGGIQNGITLAQDMTTCDLTIVHNEITNCEGQGIACYSPGGFTTMRADISYNTINGCENGSSNAAGGISIEQYGNCTLNMENNSLSDNDITHPGIYVGSTLTAPSICLNLAENSCTTDYTLVNPGDGTFLLSPCDVLEVNTGTITLPDPVESVQSCSDRTPCS